MWYTWLSLELFTTWDTALKATLGYPFLTVDEYGNPCEPMNTEYTTPVIVAENDVRAWVAAEYSTGLTPSEPPPPEPRNAADEAALLA